MPTSTGKTFTLNAKSVQKVLSNTGKDFNIFFYDNGLCHNFALQIILILSHFFDQQRER